MIFTVMLVEDEPAAMRHLKTTIEKRCPGFSVQDTAEDGLEALKKMQKNQPDLLITDIRMPHCDGLELSQKVRKQFPEIHTIILSGHQEFEYARQAIQNEVIEYMLKPINIKALETVMAEIHSRLCQKSYWKTHRLIQKYLSLKDYEISLPAGKTCFRIAVIRINGLHPKFHKKVCYNPSELLRSLLYEQITEEEKMGIYLFTGRDNNEYYILCPKEEIHYSRFKTIIEDFSRQIPSCLYYTAALSLDFLLYRITEILDILYSLLRERTVLGKSQVLYEQGNEQFQSNFVELGSVFLRNVEFLIKTSALDQVREPLQNWLRECHTQKVSLLQIEMEFNQFLNHILGFCNDKNRLQIESGIMMDKSSQDVGDFKTLLNNYMAIVLHLQNSTQKSPPGMGSRESFLHIKEYVEQHMAEDLSVPALCEQFSISQSYLNKLFHKHEKMSAIEYIRQQRVNTSIRIMKKSPHIPLKEISRIVGYEDSSYFSRVFKCQTGFSPRQYLELKNE
ncbi:response regulator [Oceanispirochaeta sp.]|jgi:two-component system response regulator YesN|uniref:response regulator transcription factor n=1 Tax=Oceanispirochaeta sp. TaxID=2035350 RepID=UPI0026313DCE|nr:response regulator [Oceanispirochaeta sp.]MDA3957810.1 response regulator [Oceanispirochaeta sp.]